MRDEYEFTEEEERKLHDAAWECSEITDYIEDKCRKIHKIWEELYDEHKKTIKCNGLDNFEKDPQDEYDLIEELSKPEKEYKICRITHEGFIVIGPSDLWWYVEYDPNVHYPLTIYWSRTGGDTSLEYSNCISSPDKLYNFLVCCYEDCREEYFDTPTIEAVTVPTIYLLNEYKNLVDKLYKTVKSYTNPNNYWKLLSTEQKQKLAKMHRNMKESRRYRGKMLKEDKYH